MAYILLSGGQGKSLWPLSGSTYSKQFIKAFKNKENINESMLQRTYFSVLRTGSNPIIVTASADQIPFVEEQLGSMVPVSVEPCCRDTFPAIVLAAEYLKKNTAIDMDEPVVVCPVDQVVDDSYFDILKTMEQQAKEDKANIVLMGITPTFPSDRYGYIVEKNKRISFIEKPQVDKAVEIVNQGALWNGGVFAFKLGYILDKAHELLDYKDYDDLYAKYDSLQKISFDYAVVEKEEKISYCKYSGTWKDVGNWNSLIQYFDKDIVGSVMIDSDCKNVKVYNTSSVPVLAFGLKDVVVVSTPEGILVSDKDHLKLTKQFAIEIEKQSREKSK